MDTNGNKFDLMRAAIREANVTMRAADEAAAGMAPMLIGRLRHCNTWDLVKLKKELANFNMRTKRWNDQ